MGEWQHLNSAPKDRPFWVWNEYTKTITQARYYTAEHFAQSEGGKPEDWCDCICELADQTKVIEYGLWIDLEAIPEPPHG